MDVDILIKAKQILTLKGGPKTKEEMKDLKIINDGYVAIKDGFICYVGEKKGDIKPKEEIDASNKVLMPAFIDPHTHLLFSGSREEEFTMRIEGKSYIEILKAGGGILKTVKDTKKAKDEEIIKEVNERLKYLLQHGTTVIEIKSGYGIDYEEELRELILINEIKKKSIVDIIPTLLAHVPKENHENYIEGFINYLIPKVAKEKLCNFVDVFCDIGAFNYEESYKIYSEAVKHNLLLKIHAGEFGDIGCGKLFSEFKFTSADHLIYIKDNEIEDLIKNKTCGVILPATSFSLMQKYCNARKYIEKGLIIALASDFSPASWIGDMQSVISIACRTLRMTQAECITAATINSAYALNLHNLYGSIEEGKIADLIILNVPNYFWIGYTLGYNHVETVIKNGKIVTEF